MKDTPPSTAFCCTGQPRPHPGRKFEQVVAGARRVFMEHGFECASVDEIAREAGVSKATLYSYFSDKRLLFLEVALTECRAQADPGASGLDAPGDTREVLGRAARRMMRFFLSPVWMQFYRIVVAESQRFPEIGREFYENGPASLRQTLVAFLEKAVAEGRLKIDDIQLAADQFPELCKAGLHTQMALGLKTCVTEAEIDRVVNGAVDMFLARYGTE